MKLKTLFEIPIYSMSKNEFNKRWDKKKSILYKMCVDHGQTEENANSLVSNLYFPRYLWEYNQIIGYIKISVSRNDIWFNIYRSLDNIYYADSKRKHFIQNTLSGGTHFYVAGWSNEYIKENILKWLKGIEKKHLKKTFFVDYSTFNNIFEYIDIKQIMESL